MKPASTGAANGAVSTPMPAATAAMIKFDSTRRFSGTADGVLVEREAEGDWKGSLYSASVGASYDWQMGRFSVRPSASIDHFKLSEKGVRRKGRRRRLRPPCRQAQQRRDGRQRRPSRWATTVRPAREQVLDAGRAGRRLPRHPQRLARQDQRSLHRWRDLHAHSGEARQRLARRTSGCSAATMASCWLAKSMPKTGRKGLGRRPLQRPASAVAILAVAARAIRPAPRPGW